RLLLAAAGSLAIAYLMTSFRLIHRCLDPSEAPPKLQEISHMRFYSLMLLACLCVACSQLGCTPSPPPAKKDKIMEATPQGTHANADHTHADPAQADHTHPEQKVAEPTPGESPESVKEEKPAEEPMEEKP